MANSAHIDTFALDNLPDKSLWPELILSHPAATYPERLNASYELLEKSIELVGPNKVAIIAGVGTREYYQNKCGYNLEGTYMTKTI